MLSPRSTIIFFFFNDTATTEIYTLSLHDALPISRPQPPLRWCAGGGRDRRAPARGRAARTTSPGRGRPARRPAVTRSEEHTSELQSRPHLVCRLLLEKKKLKLTQWQVLFKQL